LSGIAQDVRLALRSLLGARIISVVATLTLSLAIGSNIAVFSLVNSLLLRSLPVSDPERLVSVSSDFAISHGFKAGSGWSHPMFEALRQQAGFFDGALAWQRQSLTLGRGSESASVTGYFANGEFFATLGVRAVHGRVLGVDDDRRSDAARVAVISHRLWQRRFDSAPDAVGRPIEVEGVPVNVIGVMPKAFLGLEVGEAVDIVLPFAAEPLLRGKDAQIFQRRSYLLLVMLRLKDGQTIGAATNVLRGIQPQILAAQPNAPKLVEEPFTLVPAAGGTTGPASAQVIYRQPLLTMLGGVTLVLVIACINIANLLLARTSRRQRDLSLRSALGASRWQLARPLMVESFVLATTSAAGGLILAMWVTRALIPPSVTLEVSQDWRVVAYTIAIAVLTMLLAGVAPAFRATRIAPARVLTVTPRGTVGGRPGRLLNGLLVLQITVAVALLISAGLLVRTLVGLARLPLGFDADRVAVISVDTSRVEPDAGRRLALGQRLVTAIANLPGVQHAAASLWTPLTGEGALVGMAPPAGPPGSDKVNVLANFVTPRWFSTYGTALKQGRDFHDSDSATAPRVVIVNEAFVRRFLRNDLVVGRTIHDGQTIVGVVADAIFRSTQRIPGVTSHALRESVAPTMYVPLAQAVLWDRPPASLIRISVRSAAGPPLALAPGAAAAIVAIDPNLTFTVRALADDVSASLAQERTLAALSASFGGLALLLATLGLYGVMAYTASLRRTEIGLRMALGAGRPEIVRLMLGRALAVIGAGTLLGILGAAVVTRALSGMLFGVTALDPSTFVVVSGLFAAVGAVAAFIPSYRASRTDPLIALGAE
jgi:predicted permease